MMTIYEPDIRNNALLTVLQAARLLGVSQQTVRRALNRGRKDGGMDAAQRCRRVKVSGAEVKRFWREH